MAPSPNIYTVHSTVSQVQWTIFEVTAGMNLLDMSTRRLGGLSKGMWKGERPDLGYLVCACGVREGLCCEREVPLYLSYAGM